MPFCQVFSVKASAGHCTSRCLLPLHEVLVKATGKGREQNETRVIEFGRGRDQQGVRVAQERGGHIDAVQMTTRCVRRCPRVEVYGCVCKSVG